MTIKHGKLLIIVAIAFLFFHVFIFRDVVFAIPQVLNDNSILVREELIPFFDWSSQFYAQIFAGESDLTSTDEIRNAYSFWASWVRYYKILPFALVLLNSLSSYILFLSFWYLVKRIYNQIPSFLLLAIAAVSLIVHVILIYSKITHFYTLIFGFALFALSLSFTIDQLFLSTKIKLKLVIWTIVLVLFNPAIHYHILYYFIVAVLTIIKWILFYKKSKLEISKDLYFLTSLFVFSLVPYLIYIGFITTRVSTISESIPMNYWLIYYWSSPISSLLSLDSASQVDMYLHGTYIVANPRYWKILLYVFTLFFS